ncbi:hypothetical protein PSDVSF_27230 [Pseudodesulfovibrio sediminis]|uniref:DUF2304 domain-containing protein n=2 Tax=Pseudodesulfovibrio sediminis TaxID=2810563 RepID=A0ABN6EWG3_9BACT|nr:hypothetical protein PSDVSF_27230 [Pseudodesulfovibrio sediminis]
MVFNLPAAVIALLFAASVLLLVRRQRLGVLHTLWWMVLVAGTLVLGLFPAVADWIGESVGIHYPPVLPIVLALCLLFVKVLTMDMERTRQEMQIRILAQKMAAYEAELQELKGRQSETAAKETDTQR